MCIGERIDSDEWDLLELNTNLLQIIPIQLVHKEDVKGLSKNELKHKLKNRL